MSTQNAGPETHHKSNISIMIQIQLKFIVTHIQILLYGLLQNFAHATTA